MNKEIFKEPELTHKITSAFFGVAVGDALGVPFEFRPRKEMEKNPATDMIGYGTYNQPPGTWSDDSSLTFCLADALRSYGYSLQQIALSFYKWKKENFWTARNEVFDIGRTTGKAISELNDILNSGNLNELKLLKLKATENDNGNGSLMRIMPLLFLIVGKPIEDQFEMVWEVSALTHKHIRAAMACMIYLKMGEFILNGLNKEDAYAATQRSIAELWEIIDFDNNERLHFANIISSDIRKMERADIKNGGYVIDVLESSFHYFLNCKNYQNTVLSVINLGHDTDTSAAIAGGLAGLYYGLENIPERWLKQIARHDDIKNLAKEFAESLKNN